MIPVRSSSFIPSSFNPSFVPAPSPKTAWQRAVVQAPNLPFPTKGILLIVATEWMDASGGSCFPTEQQIMERAGVSRPCLTRHMRIAEERGYIRRWRWGHGNRNRRYNYQATLPTLVENGNDVTYQPPEMGNDVAQHEALPRVNPVQEQREQVSPAAPPKPAAVAPCALSIEDEEPEPAPRPAPAARPTVKAAVIPLQSKTQLSENWQLPEDWREWAQQQRPDLADLDSIAGNFRDYHLSKGTRSASWIAEWRRWVARERVLKAPAARPQAPKAPNPYSPLTGPKAPVSAAVQAAWEYSEQRRLELLRKAGIDPATGLKLGVETAAPPPTGPSPLPDGSPLPSGERETPEQYRLRIEQHRRYQLDRLAALMAGRAGK